MSYLCSHPGVGALSPLAGVSCCPRAVRALGGKLWGAGALLGIPVPCGQSCPSCSSSSSNVLGVSVHSGVRTVVSLSFVSQSVLKSLQETMGLCSIRVQSCFQELTAAPPWRHQEGLGAEGSEQPMVCQELHRHQPRARLVALGLLGAHQLPQHPLTWGTAAIMCTLPLSPENHRVQLQLVGIERPPTKHRSVDPGWSSFIHPGMLVSSIPVPEAVPALPSLLCDLRHLPCESRQTPVFSHMETPPTLTDKSPLPGFVPTQLHCAAFWQSKITRCVSPAAPVTPRGTELVAPTLPSPTMSCALCKGVRPIPRAKPVPPGTL